MTPDEQILAILRRDGVSTSAALAAELDWQERAIRRRLRRLIRDGYVFSPERGRYRLTRAGHAVLDPQPTSAEPEPEPEQPFWDMTTRDVIERWRRSR